MRTIEYGAPAHVPAFLTKLWKLVTDVSCDDLISWSVAGTSFIIYDEIRFSKELLPLYFKHNNMASFVRQLNMYGFRKLSCIDQGGMHCYKNEIEFYHQYFIKGQESLLEFIKRKIPNSKSDEPKVKQEYIDELLSNIKTLKGKQDSAEQGMKYLRRENRMLWRHVNMLADRYSKQQAVLQQLVPFFMNMVRSSQEVALKRKSALMIDEGDMRAKMARMSPPYYIEHSESDQGSSLPSPPGNVTNRGPVIHDVTELESRKMFPGNVICSPNSSMKDCEAIVDSPLSCSLESSDQTIDSPYTEPGSVETLNILNHNFERTRNDTLSPHIDMKHSPMSAASPVHLSSPMCAVSASQSPVPEYSAAPSRVSSVTIIDETTSDVPLQSISNQFDNKIGSTFSDNRMYSMSSLICNETSSMNNSPIIEEANSLMSNGASVLNEASSIISSRIINEGNSSMLNSISSVISDENSLMNNRPNIITDEASLIDNQQVLMNKESAFLNCSSSVVSSRSPTVLNDKTISDDVAASILNNRSTLTSDTSMLNGRTLMPNDGSISFFNCRPTVPNNCSSVLNNPVSITSGPASILNSRATIVNGASSSILNNKARITNDTSGNLLNCRTTMSNDRSPSVPDSRSVLNNNLSSANQSNIINEEISSIMNRKSPMMNEATSSLNNRTTLMNREVSASISNQETVNNAGPSIIRGNAPMFADSTSNKFVPTSFSMPPKNSASDINWMMNSDQYVTNEANFNSWLGQIFKSENVTTPLCSMMQREKPHDAST